MLHADDYELILLIFPRQQSLVIVVEEVYSLRLLSLEEGGVRVLFIILEEKVISTSRFFSSVVKFQVRST
jgi:hypothetical protein